MRCTDPAADLKLRNPMTGSLPGCCARAASGRAAEQRDEVAAFQLIELHHQCRQPEARRSNL
jgi:hypothetical protein